VCRLRRLHRVILGEMANQNVGIETYHPRGRLRG
jgi:hypothetical protein